MSTQFMEDFPAGRTSIIPEFWDEVALKSTTINPPSSEGRNVRLTPPKCVSKMLKFACRFYRKLLLFKYFRRLSLDNGVDLVKIKIVKM